MNIVIAIDSFKGSLSSLEAGECVKKAFADVFPSVNTTVIELADGGEGTTNALSHTMECTERTVRVTSPLSDVSTNARYAQNGKVAVIEMAQAAGLPLVPEANRNPMYTTTLGVGEMITDAIRQGCRDFIIGLGGSATNDAGIGMLSALGFRFLDKNGNTVPPTAAGVGQIETVDTTGKLSVLDECTFSVACDVKNPLCGESGCSAVFAKQKGARDEDIPMMDSWIHRFSEISDKLFGTEHSQTQGSGAAGGMGYAFLTYLNATLLPGIDLILQKANAGALISAADLVITGEGRLDKTSLMGKAPVGVAALAKQYGKPVIAFCGCCGDGATLCHEAGIDAFFPILREIVSLELALDRRYAAKRLEETAHEVALLWRASRL